MRDRSKQIQSMSPRAVNAQKQNVPTDAQEQCKRAKFELVGVNLRCVHHGKGERRFENSMTGESYRLLTKLSPSDDICCEASRYVANFCSFFYSITALVPESSGCSTHLRDSGSRKQVKGFACAQGEFVQVLTRRCNPSLRCLCQINRNQRGKISAFPGSEKMLRGVVATRS